MRLKPRFEPSKVEAGNEAIRLDLSLMLSGGETQSAAHAALRLHVSRPRAPGALCLLAALAYRLPQPPLLLQCPTLLLQSPARRLQCHASLQL